jgi:hypothetical protein
VLIPINMSHMTTPLDIEPLHGYMILDGTLKYRDGVSYVVGNTYNYPKYNRASGYIRGIHGYHVYKNIFDIPSECIEQVDDKPRMVEVTAWDAICNIDKLVHVATKIKVEREIDEPVWQALREVSYDTVKRQVIIYTKRKLYEERWFLLRLGIGFSALIALFMIGKTGKTNIMS